MNAQANTQTDAQIIATVTAAVALHRASKAVMASRIDALLMSIPDSIEIAGHTISYVRIEARCSQWANGAYPTSGTGRGHVIDGTHTVIEHDLSHFDGHNQQHQIGHVRLASSNARLTWASAKLLREIARELPGALLAYAARKTAEAAAIAAETPAS